MFYPHIKTVPICNFVVQMGTVFLGNLYSVVNLLTRDFLPRFADIPLVRRSESVLHTPEGRCK